MKAKNICKKVITLLVIMILLCSFSISVYADGNDVYDHTYIGLGENGFYAGNYLTTLFRLIDSNGHEWLAYCVDTETYIHNNSKYSRINVGDADYYTEENANKIRAIIQNAYPFISIEELRNRSGINTLSTQEAITGIQLAIWHYANGQDFTHSNSNVNSLYSWLLALAPAPESLTPVADIIINAETGYSSGKCYVTYKFKTDGVNFDGSAIALNYEFNKDIEGVYGATITDKGIDNDGYHVVKVTNIPQSANFIFSVYGVQNITFDGYFYSPEGGRDASQSLVGAYEGLTNIREDSPFECPVLTDFTVVINKLDSITLNGLQGAVFKLGNTVNFDDIVYYLQTNESGTITQTGLTAGTWYIMETVAPVGYVPYEGVYPISVGKGITECNFKNTAYGAIEIIKTDQFGGPVKDAYFDIYKGDSIDPVNLLYSNLKTDSNGSILKGDIIPGLYTVVETSAPDGYVFDGTPQLVDVLPGLKATVVKMNEKLPRGIVHLYKKDAVSNEQLAGAKIGIYYDSKLVNKLTEVITLSDSPVAVEGLLPGTYYAVELEVPSGYQLDTTVQQFEIMGNDIVELTFLNSRIPITAGNYGLKLVIGFCMLIISVISTIMLKKYYQFK